MLSVNRAASLWKTNQFIFQEIMIGDGDTNKLSLGFWCCFWLYSKNGFRACKNTFLWIFIGYPGWVLEIFETWVFFFHFLGTPSSKFLELCMAVVKLIFSKIFSIDIQVRIPYILQVTLTRMFFKLENHLYISAITHFQAPF